MSRRQVVDDWLTVLGLFAIGIVINVVLGAVVLTVLELLGLWSIADARPAFDVAEALDHERVPL